MAKGHTESISFHLYNSPSHPLLLGLPWLAKYNPHIDWLSGGILGWSKSCLSTCFHSETAPVHQLPVLQPASSHTDFPDLSGVPACYLDLKEVFNKARATSLPPHWPYDCAIDLLPGSSPPRGRLYSLSAPEKEAMQTYIHSSLEAGIIRLSSSPAGAGFFLH